jgi:hypothetical protein
MEGQFKNDDSIDRRAYLDPTTRFLQVAMMTASDSE